MSSADARPALPARKNPSPGLSFSSRMGTIGTISTIGTSYVAVALPLRADTGD